MRMESLALEEGIESHGWTSRSNEHFQGLLFWSLTFITSLLRGEHFCSFGWVESLRKKKSRVSELMFWSIQFITLLPSARFCGDFPTAYRDCRQRKSFGWGWRGSSLCTFFFNPKVFLREKELLQFGPCFLLEGCASFSDFLAILKTKSLLVWKKSSIYSIYSAFTKGYLLGGVFASTGENGCQFDFLTAHPFLSHRLPFKIVKKTDFLRGEKRTNPWRENKEEHLS